MPENRPRDGAKTSADIREAAAALFYTHGYEATSLRAIAAEVGIKVGSLYNHMAAKDELLLDIMNTVLEDLGSELDAALAAAGEDPLDRLVAAVDSHIRFHAQHARDTFVGNSELRALNADQRRMVSKRRKEYADRIRDLIRAAADRYGVTLLDTRLQTYAVLALGMHVASWFRSSSQVSLDRVVEVYTELTLRQLGLSRPAA
jgi:AcrR family transcriptional regulator